MPVINPCPCMPLRKSALLAVLLDAVLGLTCVALVIVSWTEGNKVASKEGCSYRSSDFIKCGMATIMYLIPSVAAVAWSVQIGSNLENNTNNPGHFGPQISRQLGYARTIHRRQLESLGFTIPGLFVIICDFLNWNIFGEDNSEGPLCDKQPLPIYVLGVAVIHFLVKGASIGAVMLYLKELQDKVRENPLASEQIGMPFPGMGFPPQLGVIPTMQNDVQYENNAPVEIRPSTNSNL